MKRKIKMAKSDFVADMLPKNRKEVFFDCLKMRYTTFLWAGVVLLLFALPICFLTVFGDFQVYGLYKAYELGTISESEFAKQLAAFKVSFTLPQLAALPIFGFGLAGVVKALRQLIWAEGIYYGADFRDGIKSSGLRYAAVFLFFAVLISLSAYIEAYLSEAGNPVRYIIFAISIIIVFPTALYILSLTAVYNINIGCCIKNSFILHVKTFLADLLFTAIFAGACFGLSAIPIPLIRYILTAVSIVFLLPSYIVAWLLYSCRTFDLYINKDGNPDFVGKGIGGK